MVPSEKVRRVFHRKYVRLSTLTWFAIRLESLTYIILSCFALPAAAGDWPQILGPQRNGEATGERIAVTWPSGGPKTLWHRAVGSGFAGPAVADGVLVLFHRIADQEIAEGLDAVTGQRLWKTAFAATYIPAVSDDDGPRAVPLIGDGRVILFGAMGGLHCLDLKTGATHWSRDTFEEFNSKRPWRGEPPEGYFGLGSSPILVDDKVLVNVGGDSQEAGIVAFSLGSGKTIWKATSERAGYSAPVAVTVRDTRHVLFVTRLNVVSIDPADGKVRFQFPFGRSGPAVNAASPVVLGDHVFVTASYGVGGVWVKILDDHAEEVWRDKDLMASQYTTCVEHDGCLYGIDGRQDGPPADLKCFDPQTRRVLWTEARFGYATLIKAGATLLIQKTDGTLVAAAAIPQRYQEIARAEVFQAETRVLPALSNGRYYVRDRSILKCLDLRP